MTEYTHLDVKLLAGYADNLGKATVEKMIALYQQQAGLYLQNIEQVLIATEHDQQAWKEHCHKMKGAAGSVGLTSVHALLVLMEKSQAAVEQKNADLEKLKALNKKAIDEFHQWLNA